MDHNHERVYSMNPTCTVNVFSCYLGPKRRTFPFSPLLSSLVVGRYIWQCSGPTPDVILRAQSRINSGPDGVPEFNLGQQMQGRRPACCRSLWPHKELQLHRAGAEMKQKIVGVCQGCRFLETRPEAVVPRAKKASEEGAKAHGAQCPLRAQVPSESGVILDPGYSLRLWVFSQISVPSEPGCRGFCIWVPS